MKKLQHYSSLLFPTPARVTAVYLVFSAVWIMGTDAVAHVYFSGDALATIQSIKGLFFITLSGFLIYGLLSIAHRAYAAERASANAASAEIESIDANLCAALEIRTAILEVLPSMIAILDQDGKITGVNRAWRSYCLDVGAPSRNFAVGECYKHAVSPISLAGDADRRLVQEALESILRQASDSFTIDFPVTNEKGRTRWYEVRLQGIAAGAKRGVIVVHADITDRKTREASLVVSEARFNALAWNAPYGVMVVRGEAILFANRKARRMLNMPGEGATLDELGAYLRRSVDRVTAHVLRASESQTGRVRIDEEELPWNDGPAQLLFLTDGIAGTGDVVTFRSAV